MQAPQHESAGKRDDTARDLPSLPPGKHVQLPGRGGVFVRDLAGPCEDAPAVFLLHGWTATADLTWHTAYETLGRHFRVIAFDQRGHGRGLRTDSTFRLEDCADDVAAVATALGIDQFIPVGYSMGGPIASLVWRQHRPRVQGLVLCATSRQFNHSTRHRAAFSVLNGTSSLASTTPFRALSRLSCTAWSRRLEYRGGSRWMVEELGRHDWTRVLEAGRSIGRFDSRTWAGQIDVPTAVVAAMDDDVVPTHRQIELARAIRGASLHRVQGGHLAYTDRSGAFAAAVLGACQSVIERTTAQPAIPFRAA